MGNTQSATRNERCDTKINEFFGRISRAATWRVRRYCQGFSRFRALYQQVPSLFIRRNARFCEIFPTLFARHRKFLRFFCVFTGFSVYSINLYYCTVTLLALPLDLLCISAISSILSSLFYVFSVFLSLVTAIFRKFHCFKCLPL